MQTLINWSPTIILLLVAAVMIIRDPRRMRCALLSTAILLSVILVVFENLLKMLSDRLGPNSAYVAIGILILGLVMSFGVALFLIWAGIVLLKREGLSVSHSLSLVVGVAILVYIGLFYVAAVKNSNDMAVILLMAGGPIGLFSFILVSYVFYSAVYGFFTNRFGKPGEATVVLGSGLIGDRVPPLLARRVDLGVTWFGKSCARWSDSKLVMSGGQGSDEASSEGAAMLKYALDTHPELSNHKPGASLLVEDQSTSTEENLRFTERLLGDESGAERWTVVTSNFHAFRAANLMSRMRIKGNAVGAPTRSYFWASAKLREFVAILVSSKWTTIAFGALSCFPLAMLLIVKFTQ